MKPFRFSYNQMKTLTDLGYNEGVCDQARFALDQPITLWPDDELELENGQWFQIMHDNGREYRFLLSGRWMDTRTG